jgi:hypothetical protein
MHRPTVERLVPLTAVLLHEQLIGKEEGLYLSTLGAPSRGVLGPRLEYFCAGRGPLHLLSVPAQRHHSEKGDERVTRARIKPECLEPYKILGRNFWRMKEACGAAI